MNRSTMDALQEIDIRRAAAFMVERYGRVAIARAARRACVLLLAGHPQAASIWSRISLLSTQLADADAVATEASTAPAPPSVNVIPLRTHSPYLSGRVRPTPPSPTGRRVAVGRLIPSLSPSVGTPLCPSPLRS